MLGSQNPDGCVFGSMAGFEKFFIATYVARLIAAIDIAAKVAVTYGRFVHKDFWSNATGEITVALGEAIWIVFFNARGVAGLVLLGCSHLK